MQIFHYVPYPTKEVLKDYIDEWSRMMTKQDAGPAVPRGTAGPQLMAYASKYA